MKKIILLLTVFIGFISCDCPGEDRYERGYYSVNHNQKNDRLYADLLLGTWSCYYPMTIKGTGVMIGSNTSTSFEMKSIKFIDNKRCDITIQPVGNIERSTYTFIYSYDGKSLKFTRNSYTIILAINGFLYPELYLQDSFGRYTIKKCLAAGC